MSLYLGSLPLWGQLGSELGQNIVPGLFLVFLNIWRNLFTLWDFMVCRTSLDQGMVLTVSTILVTSFLFIFSFLRSFSAMSKASSANDMAPLIRDPI